MTYAVSNNSPQSGQIAWSSVHIVFDGVSYATADGYTAAQYVYWQKASPLALQTSNTFPSLTQDDAVIFINTGGIALSVLDSATTTGAMIAPGSIGAAAFAPGVQAVSVVSSLPNPTNYVGPPIVLLTTDGKLYRYVGGVWATSVSAVDIVGTIQSAQLNNAIVQLEDGTVIPMATVAQNSQVPSVHFVGNFATAPSVASNIRNAVYKNTTDGNSYILAGETLSWGLYLESGVAWDIQVESVNGTIFRVGQSKTTMLIAHVFRNGVDVTAQIQESRFRWRRVSYEIVPPPNDDAAWNALYATGYKQIQVTVDTVYCKATFHCDVMDS